MSHLVVVTGGSAGIGRALLAAAPAGARRVDISRRGTDLAGVDHVRADLADPADWSTVARAFREHVRAATWERVTVVHSAGVLAPIGHADEIDTDSYARAVLLNSAATQVVGQVVLAALRDLEARRELVLLSSGAARTAYVGWSHYSAGKAALDQWVRVAGAEQAERGGVTVLAVRPGVVATGMQELIRGTDERDFPRVERFRQLHEQGQLEDPDAVAGRLWRLLDDPGLTTGAVLDLRERERDG